MTDRTDKMQRKGGVTALIRNEISSDTNRRFLSRMPVFRPERDLPQDMHALLGQLESAEAKGRGRNRKI